KRFEDAATMVVARSFLWLTSQRSRPSFSIKRDIVSALYQYREHPLHPDIPFFSGFRPLQLKTEAEIFAFLFNDPMTRRDVKLNFHEYEKLFHSKNQKYVTGLAADLHRNSLSRQDVERMKTAEEQWAILRSLRRQGFYLQGDEEENEVDEVARRQDDQR